MTNCVRIGSGPPARAHDPRRLPLPPPCSVDGADPEQLPITPACGGPNADPNAYGCYSPSWSPDGEQIVLTRSDPSTESIYIVKDGSGLVQVTDGEDDTPISGSPNGLSAAFITLARSHAGETRSGRRMGSAGPTRRRASPGSAHVRVVDGSRWRRLPPTRRPSRRPPYFSEGGPRGRRSRLLRRRSDGVRPQPVRSPQGIRRCSGPYRPWCRRRRCTGCGRGRR